jgi:ComF family protein
VGSPTLRALGRLSAAAGEALFSLLAPPRCAACDASLEGQAVFCHPCKNTLLPLEVAPITPPGIARLRAFGEYGGALAQAIRRFKYDRRPDLARPLGALVARAAAGSEAALVVPVPLHPARLARRGYNQAVLLGRITARSLGARFDARGLRRLRLGAAQARLERAERLAAVEGAFAARRDLSGQDVLLVDDVATTGATLAACAAALRVRGAHPIEAVVVAWNP